MFLSVLNLQFHGNLAQSKRPRTGFKYKSSSINNQHRMFVKEVIDYTGHQVEESTLTTDNNYHFDDYIKYILNKSEQSRPSSGKSSIYYGSYRKMKEKATQVDTDQNASRNSIKLKRVVSKKKHDKVNNTEKKDLIVSENVSNENTKISYHYSSKRKSLTISRTQSPETIQVIRVDVVCNNSTASSSLSMHEGDNITDEKIKNNNCNTRGTLFTDKYLLTNTTKTLDQNICGGSKVTLLCKTFKLANRANNIDKNQLPVMKKDVGVKRRDFKRFQNC